MRAIRTTVWLFVFLAVFLGASGRAEAGRVTVSNQAGSDVLLAFMFYDVERNDFVVRGWYRVPAGKQLYWNFDFDPGKYVYWYARNADGGDKQWPSRGDRPQAVVDEPMDHVYDKIKEMPRAYNVEFATVEADAEGGIWISLVD